MKVSIVRGGGLAGLVTISTAESASLAPEDAALLRAKAEQAGLLGPRDQPGRAGGQGRPDAFDYELTVEDDQGRTHTTRVGEGELTGPLRALITYVGSVPGHREEVAPPG
jgi:hypothetical protein